MNETEIRLPLRTLEVSETDRPEFFHHLFEMLSLGKRGAQDALAVLMQPPDQNRSRGVFKTLASIALKEQKADDSAIEAAAKKLENLNLHTLFGCCEALTDFENTTPESTEFFGARCSLESQEFHTGKDQERMAPTLLEYFVARSPGACVSLLQVIIEHETRDPLELIYLTLVRNERRRLQRTKAPAPDSDTEAQFLKNLKSQPFRSIVFICKGLQRVN
jgi:hypothetical protein